MIRALSLAAALALLPLSAALAQTPASLDPASAEAALEAAGAAFEMRMEEFGARAEAIAEDESLSEGEREAAIMALWAEYQPEVLAFTAAASTLGPQIASEALAEVDVEALVAEALSDPSIGAAMAMAQNGAWASQDPEHMATYGLMADYALGQVSDEMDAEADRIEAAAAAAEATAAARDD
jgi:hypothetical protein